ncbi:MAG: 50S ribosomal protein L33 [Vampirovibrionales bacterium]|jgi:large subunit ribosomal protein L33|nr:50S ribosomal protein L33 [Vampirovibrionales bacterium]
MAKKGKGAQHIRLKSTESGHEYHTRKNKQKHPQRLEMKKYDPLLQRHVTYREEKK